MAIDQGRAFEFMRINYKYGLIDEIGSIVGDALDAAMREAGMDMEDVLNLIDGAREETVEKLNGFVERRGALLLRLAANEPVTRLQVRLLRVPAVRRAAVRAATRVMSKRLSAAGALAAASGAEAGR